jgi:nicotinate (nicotinamide) nucleotide adenylyltransferase
MEPTIIIIGGSFNPPTIAHLELANTVKNNVNADIVLMIPTKASYMQKWKQYQNSDILSDDIRIKALMAMENNWLKVELCELEGIVSGSSFDTIEYIKKKYHSNNVYFAIGSDKLEEIPRWYNSDGLLKRNKFIVVQRNNDSIELIIEENRFLRVHKSSFICCKTEDKSLQKVSSTAVRKFIEQGKFKEVEKLVPEDVYSIILKNRASISNNDIKNK